MADFKRKIPCILSLVIGGLGFAAAPGAHADPGLERERQLTERLARDVRIGDPEWLRADGEEFFALYPPPFQYPARGGVILCTPWAITRTGRT